MATLTIVDWVIIAILVGSVLAGIVQGFFRSIFGLGGLVLGLVIAAWNYPSVAGFFRKMIHSEQIANAVAKYPDKLVEVTGVVKNTGLDKSDAPFLHLDGLPGKKRTYSAWQELFEGLKQMLSPYRDLAMQYSPNNGVFTISLVDAGTAELIRGLGKNIVSSGDLVAKFEATWTEEQIQSHYAARDSVVHLQADPVAMEHCRSRSENGVGHFSSPVESS